VQKQRVCRTKTVQQNGTHRAACPGPAPAGHGTDESVRLPAGVARP
jgi:hypothetical protein